MEKARWIRCLPLILSVLLIGGNYGWLQGIAWIGMAMEGVQSQQSFSEVLSNTLDGSKPCNLCHAIQKNKKSELPSEDYRPHDLKKKDISLDLRWVFCPPDRPFLGEIQSVNPVGPWVTYHPDLPPPRSIKSLS
ncbi:MAG: hypothetical protein AAF558_13005 [Verrucomicrobiota bacterium]